MERETIKDKKTGVERKRMKEKKLKRQARATDRCRICVPKRIPGIIPIQGMIIPGKLSSAAQEGKSPGASAAPQVISTLTLRHLENNEQDKSKFESAVSRTLGRALLMMS